MAWWLGCADALEIRGNFAQPKRADSGKVGPGSKGLWDQEKQVDRELSTKIDRNFYRKLDFVSNPWYLSVERQFFAIAAAFHGQETPHLQLLLVGVKGALFQSKGEKRSPRALSGW